MTLFQPAVYMQNLIGADLAFFFSFLLSLSLCGGYDFSFSYLLRFLLLRHDRAISSLGLTLAGFVGPEVLAKLICA